MTAIDLLFIAIVAFGCIYGAIKGFVMQIASLISILLGIYIARLYVSDLSLLFVKWFSISDYFARPGAFVTILVLVWLVIRIIAGYFNKAIKLAFLSALNKLLGALVGSIKYLLILSLALNVYVAIKSHFSTEKAFVQPESIFFNPIKKIFVTVLPYVNEADFSVNDSNKN